MVLKVKVNVCSSGSIMVDGKPMIQEGGAKKAYYMYKGSRFSKVHVINRRKHIYSAKEKLYVPITSKEVIRGGGGNTNDGQCVDEEVNVYMPKPIFNIIVKEAEKNPDTAARMRLYFALGMRDKINETRNFMLKYVANAIRKVLKSKHHITIRPEYFDVLTYGKEVHRLFRIDRNSWNSSDPVTCSMKSWKYKNGLAVQLAFIEESSPLDKLEENPVIAELFEYLSSLKEPMYISCSSKEFNWDEFYINRGLEKKIGKFANKPNSKAVQKLLHYIEERNFLELLKKHINVTKTDANPNNDNIHYPEEQEQKDISERLYEHIDTIITDAKNTNSETNFTEIVKELSNVVLCMHNFFGDDDDEEHHPDFECMWEIFFPIPDAD